MAKKNSTSWLCGECGLTQAKWTGSCNGCKSWNTFKEFREKVVRENTMSIDLQAKPVKIGQVQIKDDVRVACDFKDLNRALGGGVVAGSFILLAGNPGIGSFLGNSSHPHGPWCGNECLAECVCRSCQSCRRTNLENPLKTYPSTSVGTNHHYVFCCTWRNNSR